MRPPDPPEGGLFPGCADPRFGCRHRSAIIAALPGDRLYQVLLRVVDKAQVGWKCMPLQEFLESIDLASWQDGQQLVGMILPQESLPQETSPRNRKRTLH